MNAGDIATGGYSRRRLVRSLAGRLRPYLSREAGLPEVKAGSVTRPVDAGSVSLLVVDSILRGERAVVDQSAVAKPPSAFTRTHKDARPYFIQMAQSLPLSRSMLGVGDRWMVVSSGVVG